MMAPFDTRFTMPGVDDPALTEIGVILSGLGVDRLLAGLGLCAGTADPAPVTLLVDHLRHGDPDAMAGAIAEGARLWRAARPALASVDRGPSVSASIRQAWERALRTVTAAELDDTGTARFAYLAACWLRCAEVDDTVGTAACRSAIRTTMSV